MAGPMRSQVPFVPPASDLKPKGEGRREVHRPSSSAAAGTIIAVIPSGEHEGQECPFLRQVHLGQGLFHFRPRPISIGFGEAKQPHAIRQQPLQCPVGMVLGLEVRPIQRPRIPPKGFWPASPAPEVPVEGAP